MPKMFSMICVIWLAVGGYAQSVNEAQTLSPEVKRTVDVLVGQWRFEGRDAEPGAKEQLRVTMAFDCRLAALGAAVACTLSGNVANSGPIEAASIVGYDSDEQIVHWMEISSTGEYHDHRGKWKGEMIAFEPLVYKNAGKKYTETFTLSFPSAGTFVLKSVTETHEGLSTITGIAKRQ
jgi:hypothetical protein